MDAKEDVLELTYAFLLELYNKSPIVASTAILLLCLYPILSRILKHIEIIDSNNVKRARHLTRYISNPKKSKKAKKRG
jgi:hypothetical protein